MTSIPAVVYNLNSCSPLNKGSLMQNGIEQLSRSAEALCDWECPLRDRLAFAADQFRKAYVCRDQWPESLQRQADELSRSFSVPGTVSRMSEDVVLEISSRMLEFVEQAELALAARQLAACM